MCLFRKIHRANFANTLRNIEAHVRILISSCKSSIIHDVIGFIVLIGCENWSLPITRWPRHDLWGRP